MKSALYVSGDNIKALEQGLESAADALFIDLSDAVLSQNKQRARQRTTDFLQAAQPQSKRPRLFVQINPFKSQVTELDLKAAIKGGAEGIVLPYCRHGKNVTRLDAQLRVHEAENGLDDGQTQIIALAAQTAVSALHTGSYYRASTRLKALIWGGEDLALDVGARQQHSNDGSYSDLLRFARIQTLLGAVAAGVQPIDTSHHNLDDEEGLIRACYKSRNDGFTAKTALYPEHIPIINEIFATDPAQPT